MIPDDSADRERVKDAYAEACARLRRDEHFALLPTSRDVHGVLVQVGVESIPLRRVVDIAIAARLQLADVDADEPTRKVPALR